MIGAFLRSLFCEHEWEFFRNIYGEEVMKVGWRRSVWICQQCGWHQYRKELYEIGPTGVVREKMSGSGV